ncbi:putative ATP synthase subunit f, mitochondrial [Gigantopelta aegis]|uniref:putative ATP synthase subunit f, mitochondrial n=1 Tax=Gigantopelta aegis TaxID=1735272 RepID=UPI001B88B804|nr:putative ATP synthase subunit f, mitochondrial [Gigantopelta aegis]
MVFGGYPPEFNPRIHGPYNPATYYGKRDIPFGEVKLGELGSWVSRRKFTPQTTVQVVTRSGWRWAEKYLLPKKMSIAPIAQFCVCMSIGFYFLTYKAHTYHRHAKYH